MIDFVLAIPAVYFQIAFLEPISSTLTWANYDFNYEAPNDSIWSEMYLYDHVVICICYHSLSAFDVYQRNHYDLLNNGS